MSLSQKRLHITPLHLAGISVRTSNKAEMSPDTGKIPQTIQKFLSTAGDMTQPLYCVYTEYESDEHGEYTYFVGQEMSTVDSEPSSLEKRTVGGGEFIKLTTDPGPMPAVCIDAWQKIWAMSSEELGGTRAYQADIEVYDARAANPEQTVLDILIGVKS